MTVHTNCNRGETVTVRSRKGDDRRTGSGGKKKSQRDYRVVGLVDAQDEDQLGEEECGRSVVDDAGLVALHGSQAEEEDGGEEQEAKRHPHCAPRQHFDGQNLSVLQERHNNSNSVLKVCMLV